MNEKAIDNSAGGCLILIFPIAFLIIFLFTTWPLLLGSVIAYAAWNIWQRYQWQQWCNQVNPVFHQLIKENRGSITPLDLAMKANFSAVIAKRYLDTKAEEFGAQRRDYEDRGPVYYFISASTLGTIFDESEPASLPEKKHEWESLKDVVGKVNNVGENLSQGVRQKLEDETESELLSEVTNQSQPSAQTPAIQELSYTPSEEIPIPSIPQPTPEFPPPTEHLQESDEEQPTPFSPETSEQTISLIQSELAKRLDVHSSTVYKHRDDPDFPEWSRIRDPEGIAWKFSPETKEFSPVEED